MSLRNQTFGVSFYGLHLTSKIKPLFWKLDSTKQAAQPMAVLPAAGASNEF